MVCRKVPIVLTRAFVAASLIGSTCVNADVDNGDGVGGSSSEPGNFATTKSASRPRLIVLTDMTSIKTAVREPDDAQSMIRLMLYANEFDIEGLIASSGLQHGHIVRPWIIHRIVHAYELCRPNLLLNDDGYPSAKRLKSVIKSGQPKADEGMPLSRSIGKGKETEASRWIIRMADKPDDRPLWIVIWGGSADLAQALWTVRETRSPDQLKRFIAKLRVQAGGDQDSTGHWIKSQFPDLFYATRTLAGRGMYRGGDTTLVSSAWVQENIRGHGALGDIYPDYRGGDKWSRELGRIKGIKGGDSATYMGLIRNGLNVPNHLTWENWGGRIEPDDDNPNRYYDAIDPVLDYKSDFSPYLAAVYRWRPDFQPNYAARFDWCVQPYSQANHAPMEHGDGKIVNEMVTAGERVKLQSGDWRDPDGNELTFRWQFLEEESSYPNGIEIEERLSKLAYFDAPLVDKPQSIHMLLTVKDRGNPVMSAYKRVHFTVYP